MINITDEILNFQTLLVSIAKCLSFIGLDRGSDYWEELTENAFDTLVKLYLSNKYNLTVSQQYGEWNKDNLNVIVKIDVGADFLIGKEKKEAEYTIQYKKVNKFCYEIEFLFVEFNNPYFNDDEISALDYFTGLDDNGNIVCVHKKYCRCYTHTH